MTDVVSISLKIQKTIVNVFIVGEGMFDRYKLNFKVIVDEDNDIRRTLLEVARDNMYLRRAISQGDLECLQIKDKHNNFYIIVNHKVIFQHGHDYILVCDLITPEEYLSNPRPREQISSRKYTYHWNSYEGFY